MNAETLIACHDLTAGNVIADLRKMEDRLKEVKVPDYLINRYLANFTCERYGQEWEINRLRFGLASLSTMLKRFPGGRDQSQIFEEGIISTIEAVRWLIIQAGEREAGLIIQEDRYMTEATHDNVIWKMI